MLKSKTSGLLWLQHVKEGGDSAPSAEFGELKSKKHRSNTLPNLIFFPWQELKNSGSTLPATQV